MKNRSNDEFSQRTDALARRVGVALNDLEKVTGISSRMLYAYRKPGYPISEKAWRKLATAEIRAGIAVGEPVFQYGPSPPGKRAESANAGPAAPKGGDIGTPPDPRMTFAPGFAPKPPEPTKAGCLAHLAAYLDMVEEVPGGVAHTWVQLQMQFPIAQAQRMRDTVQQS